MTLQSPLINLPYFILPNQLVYLPGVTYQTGLSKSDSIQIATHFNDKLNDIDEPLAKQLRELLTGTSNQPRVKLQETSISLLPGNALIIACIPYIESTPNKTIPATISRITSIRVHKHQCIISFNALFRAHAKLGNTRPPKTAPRHGECTFSINVDDIAPKKVTKGSTESLNLITARALSTIKSVYSFNRRYAEFRKEQKEQKLDEKLLKILLQLTPLASLMNAELSGKETGSQLQKLYELYGQARMEKDAAERLRTISQLNDVFVAVFPFSFRQRISYLGEFDHNRRLEMFRSYLEFASFVLDKQLDMKYVAEQWAGMKDRLSADDFKMREMQFVTSHLQSLKQLIRLYERGSERKGNAFGSVPDPQSEKLKGFIGHLDGLRMSPDGKRLIKADYSRMKHMPKSGSEYQVLRTYMDVIMDIPWQKLHKSGKSQSINLHAAMQQLDNDHYGMQRAKERIIEYLAVLKMHNRVTDKRNMIHAKEEAGAKSRKAESLKNSENSNKRNSSNLSNSSNLKNTKNTKNTTTSVISIRNADALGLMDEDNDTDIEIEDQGSFNAPILLLTGPPGVGKTSLAKSVAKTLGRKFQRVSLGGLDDFADLKGHRRTYVGAIPGLIIQALRRAQSYNPVILLDEIDKVGGAARNCNPEAALLEILDPEQNKNFQDHYVGFPVDLSQVVFICTANNAWNISTPLRDRMEMVELSGYSYLEKVEICKRYLIPRQMQRNCLPPGSLHLDDDTILKIATEYTNEPGIRSLEKRIASICRIKAIEHEQATESGPSTYSATVKVDDLPKYIGAGRTSARDMHRKNFNTIQEQYGVANGLSYNNDGSGSLLSFEMVGLPGEKSLICTGNLGDVLLESAQIADVLVGYLLNRRMLVSASDSFNIEAALDRYRSTEVHLHVPEGAISKDGPSAGITITTCLLSLILRKPIPADVAMTGEITLAGNVLPIGGLKEKLLGAHLSGCISKVIVPRLNRRDIIESYTSDMKDRKVSHEKLRDLILTEEKLISGNKQTKAVFGEPEKRIRDELGIQIVYVDDFSDVIEQVWQGAIRVKQAVQRERTSRL